MKSPLKRACMLFVLTAGVLSISIGDAVSSDGDVSQTIKKAMVPTNDAVKINTPMPITESTVLVSTRHQGGQFRTETRKNRIERFRCSQCHNNKPVTATDAAPIAHNDIVLDHGGVDKPLDCMTCHNQDDRDYLVTETGTKIDMDHSYEMCGQCHFRQKKDWVGGAHGKRLSYWTGERVVKNCTSCHDPHSPLFKKRWPKTYSPPLAK
ncbi:MAG: hypothetical protein HKM93_18450 [Desulfobacteraceae bacterium]|nr:hypothetical protein [Desulfobacteraceae bacterium]